MKAQDLRTGNLVEYNGMYLPISSIKSPKPLNDEIYADKWLVELFDGASWIDCTIEEIKPIELTEDWLLKIGFEIEEIHAGLSEADFGHNPITQDFILTIKNTGSGWFYRNGYFKIEFVHQLQNIYHALAGEELTIK